jgi:RNA recognition motif-containing protein
LKIYIGNLSFATTDQAVRDLFEPHGLVDGAVHSREYASDRVRGFGFVDMPDADEAPPGIAAGAGRHGHWGKAPKR